MTQDKPSNAYAGNALSSQTPVTMPETMANRAQSVTRSVIMRWLRGVISSDSNGYAVISGGGRTIIVLYSADTPISAAVTRGPNVEHAVDALEALRTDGPSDFFAMTYHLPDGAPEALSGLFAGSIENRTLTDPRRDLKELLAEKLDSKFSGSVVVRYEDILWSVILLVEGEIIGGYGSDDTTLKGSIDDTFALLHLDKVDIAVYECGWNDDLADVISLEATSYLGSNLDEAVAETEAAMISLLSELESAISGVGHDDPPKDLVCALVESYRVGARTGAAGSRGHRQRTASSPTSRFTLDCRRSCRRYGKSAQDT